MAYQQVLRFWFEELKPKQWWMKSDTLDKLIARRFNTIHQQAIQGELYGWRDSPEGALAEIIVLDQFSRNIYRGDRRSFAFDGMALVLAQEAIKRGFDKHLSITKRIFLYMPYMHSESLDIHKKALELFSQPGLEENYQFEQAHVAIIKKFGRYPHRNTILRRISSKEESDFLCGNSGI